jgi:predicted dehydrogenase
MNRRDFLQVTGLATLGALASNAFGMQGSGPSIGRTRPRRSKSVMGLAHKPMDKVRVAFIGVGARGSGHVTDLLNIEGVEIVAICDLYKDWAERSAAKVVAAGRRAPTLYVEGPKDYKNMLAREDIDAVWIATPWEEHIPMALEAMKRGKHAFIEVPAAPTMDEAWAMVETAEETQRHCMMLENCCYGREEMLVLNMARQGIFGELLHGEGAYIHDLRGQMMEVDRGTGSWRTPHYQKRNGNLYPTHGLGPVAQYMSINRGDRFAHLTSMSSNSRVRAIYAKEHFPKDHKWNKTPFQCGDINTTLIRTAMGRTIMVQWDEQLPRPYNRLNLLQGTKGVWGGYPQRCVIEGMSTSTDKWEQDAELKKWYDKFEHPLWQKQGDMARKMGGHGGMDFIMNWRIIYCLLHGEPLDQDVYDGAAWSAVSPLSEWSVARNGQSVEFPDFTRGDWKTAKPLGIVGA